MKSVASLVLFSSLGLALPIYESTLIKGTRTIEGLDPLQNDVTQTRTEHLILSQGQTSWQDMEPSPASRSEYPGPSFQDYDQDRQEQELAFIRSNEKEFNLPARISKSFPTSTKQAERGPLELSKSTQPKTSSYGVFLGKWLPFKKPYSEKHCHRTHYDPNTMSDSNPSQPDSHTLAYLKPLDVLDVMESYGPECVGLAIFVLVPIAYFVLELLELAIKYFIRERFPERGRDRVRLLGPERQLRALDDLQREKTVGDERWWYVRQPRG
ncbi:uncharacterized protein N7483_007643 [Penicillium malachiteum]|uniref:uncharacterized protein n=1 Tax=Penicillium malachiteum TaxID=1324776 RepID=UPI002549AEA5|nr:uncharacterized protein N7483_007643 [Penicillium malachiteum]KAJ5726286.1 hypothetical protein N7483_007643 [Penicillium malachiteum]